MWVSLLGATPQTESFLTIIITIIIKVALWDRGTLSPPMKRAAAYFS